VELHPSNCQLCYIVGNIQDYYSSVHKTLFTLVDFHCIYSYYSVYSRSHLRCWKLFSLALGAEASS
jgi:hypothetical protein